MTIEQAKEVLENHTQHFVPTEDIHALNIAIKSLEAWDKVIEEIDKEFNEYDNVLTDLDYATGLGYALAVIKEHLGGES